MTPAEPPRFKSQTADKFSIRMPDGLRDALATAAKASGRSMNAEIVFHLEKIFMPDAREMSGLHQFKLMIPSDVMEQVRDSAAAANRTLPAEIVFRLIESFRTEGGAE